MPERFESEVMPNETQDNEAGESVYGPSVLIAALDELRSMAEEARSVPLSPNIIMNKAAVLDLLAQAREALPEDLVAADAVVADADAVLDRADAAAEVTVAEASAKAKTYVEEAREKADAMLREASEESDRRVARAQEEASKIRRRTEEDVTAQLEAAKERAADMVSKETVLRTAEDQAREILQRARTEGHDLRLGADDYAATALSQVAQVLSDLTRRTEAGRRTIAERSGFDGPDVEFRP
jgi:hypothetical protein